MDSLAVMELVMALEEEFSISMEDRAVDSIKTVKDAVHAIEAAVG
jgi:acyl carrier protein